MSKAKVVVLSFGAVVALGLTVVAQAQTLYGVSGGTGAGHGDPGSFVIIDQGTGAATVVGVPYGGVGLTGLAVSPTGHFFAVTSVTNPDDTSHLIEINPATGGLLNDIGPMYDASGNGCAIGDLSFQPGTGVLFGMAANQSSVGTRCGALDLPVGTGGYLMTVDTTTGVYTIIGRDASFRNETGGIAFAPEGTLYFTSAWHGDTSLYTLDPATGNVLSTVAMSSVTGFMGLTFRTSDDMLVGGYQSYPDDTSIYTVDPTTGAATSVGNPGDILIHDLDFAQPQQQAAAIPALSRWGALITAALLATAAAILIRRRFA